MIKFKEALIFAAMFLAASIVLVVLFYFSESFHPKDATTVLATVMLIRAFLAALDWLSARTRKKQREATALQLLKGE